MSNLPPLDLLQSWVAVVEFESVSRAAAHLGVSQAAVSQHIRSLEEHIGVSLLDRTFRPALPTPAGRRLHEDAARLLEQASQIASNARNVARTKGSTVRIGCVDSFAATICPQLVRGLASSSVRITLWSGITPVLDEQMNTRQLDVAITTEGSTKRSGVSRQQLFNEQYLAVFPRGFQRDSNETLTSIGKRLKFIRYSARSVIGEQIQTYLDGLVIELERTFEFDTTDPLLSLVAEGLGWALITPLCLWQSRHYLANLDVVPLSELRANGRPCPSSQRTFYMLWRRDELGNLPADIRNIVTQVAKRQLSPAISATIGIPAAKLFSFPGEES